MEGCRWNQEGGCTDLGEDAKVLILGLTFLFSSADVPFPCIKPSYRSFLPRPLCGLICTHINSQPHALPSAWEHTALLLLLFSRSVVSYSLQPHGLWHSRLPCPSLSPSLLKFMSVESAMPSNHLILCCPLLLLPSIFPSIRVLSNESMLHIRWPKYWSFSFSISPSSEYSGLTSFTIDRFDRLSVQGTWKSLFQHYTVRASVLGTQPFLLSSSHIRAWVLEKP